MEQGEVEWKKIGGKQGGMKGGEMGLEEVG